MPKVTFLPHPDLCPTGATIEVKAGEMLCEQALAAGIELEHACGMVCACTTCHVIVRKGYASMPAPDEKEEDLLDKAWGLEPNSRLSCQCIVQTEDLVVEIPKYSINQVKENH